MVDTLEVVRDDPYLAPYQEALLYRVVAVIVSVYPADPLPYLCQGLSLYSDSRSKFTDWINTIDSVEGGIDKFTKGYEWLGFNVDKATNAISYREWAPNATDAYLIDNWNRTSHRMKKGGFGVFEIVLPPTAENGPAIPHGSKVKISMVIPNSNDRIERIPAYIRYATQDLSKSASYEGIFWNPPQSYVFKHTPPPKPKCLRIYESHVGIASPEGRVATYTEFKNNVLPRISYLGYNTIQLMAIMEHPYYASFGYQVTNYFAPTSRCGTPEDLKALIDEAHRMGITVLLDVVHSHSSKNVLDGLNEFDGTDHCYFHEGGRGRHDLWDS
ncbi:alpha-1,4-glucan branching enzyme, partial [Entophlyctis luteolus]